MGYDYDDDEEDYVEPAPTTAPDELEAAILELVPKLSDLSPEAMRGIAIKAAKELAAESESYVRKEVKKLVLAACGDELKAIAQEHMKVVFTEALTGKVMVGDKWSQKETEIRDIIQGEMKEALSKLKSEYTRDNYVKTAINDFLGKELQDIAKGAVADFKKDVLSQLTREATQRLTSTIANALAGDTKLLGVLKAME